MNGSLPPIGIVAGIPNDLPAYARSYERYSEGKAEGFIFGDDQQMVNYPYMRRPIPRSKIYGSSDKDERATYRREA